MNWHQIIGFVYYISFFGPFKKSSGRPEGPTDGRLQVTAVAPSLCSFTITSQRRHLKLVPWGAHSQRHLSCLTSKKCLTCYIKMLLYLKKKKERKNARLLCIASVWVHERGDIAYGSFSKSTDILCKEACGLHNSVDFGEKNINILAGKIKSCTRD